MWIKAAEMEQSLKQPESQSRGLGSRPPTPKPHGERTVVVHDRATLAILDYSGVAFAVPRLGGRRVHGIPISMPVLLKLC